MAEVVSGIGKSTAADDAGCLEEPDMTMIINSLSKAIHEQIVLTQTKGDTAGSGIFDETEHPIMKAQLPEDYKERCIDQENITRFLVAFSGAAKLTAGSMLIVSIFISRLIVRIGLRIHNHTWKRIVIGTSIVVSKVWIDIPVHNSDFKLVLPALAADGLLKLERELGLMAYNVSVSREDYACHYYCIRSSDDNTGAVLTCVKEFVNTTGPSPTSCASKHEHLPILDSGENLAHLNPTLTWDGIVPDVVFGKSCTRSSETLPKWTSLTSSE
ncbi:hypothetical protein SARC_10773 [Sphaeroforma arctica JP610]|uniref:Uncharacterized protein n=1 Tax=Sphaeroforma arctica JP610 TaxID=667725 RepID=A0A0L0FL55_9EUKA|nr:hypothetical protein SARC_10773 [Sphaeroforma arctica JP610]KNC76743.1 hypothetical protein SARC_10773 [Sphaeroforma arctica JP610]|eukprot:XP_014150645.1 hypothetical protein SARC_10773 [Sphaeroforma arctica JP610]